MLRVLIADNNPDSHELVDDLIELNFRDVQIDHALTGQAFLDKLNSTDFPFNLILFHLDLDASENGSVLKAIREQYAHLFPRMLFLASGGSEQVAAPEGSTVLKTPFSLDLFSEVVKHHCVE
jgi:CheY-like chemotaxis protein